MQDIRDNKSSINPSIFKKFNNSNVKKLYQDYQLKDGLNNSKDKTHSTYNTSVLSDDSGKRSIESNANQLTLNNSNSRSKEYVDNNNDK